MILHSDGDNTNFSSIKHHNLYRKNQLYHKNTILIKIIGSILYHYDQCFQHGFGHCSWKSSRSWKVKSWTVVLKQNFSKFGSNFSTSLFCCANPTAVLCVSKFISKFLIQSKGPKEPVKLSKGIGNRLSLIWHSESTGPKINLKRSIRTENNFGNQKIRFMRISGPTGPSIPEPKPFR